MGTRKHLNYLIYDYNKAKSPEATQTLEETFDAESTVETEFEETIDPTTPKQKPWTMPYEQVSLFSRDRRDGRQNVDGPEQDADFWPPFPSLDARNGNEKGGEHAHELSGLVSNRRTPSGNFLNKSNPSLWSKTKPESDYSKSGSLRESITLEALRTIRKSPKK